MKAFPRTEVEGVSLPRMLIGSNWVLGYSHTSVSADKMIQRSYAAPEAVKTLIEAYLDYDIDAVMGLFAPDTPLLKGIRMAEEATGKAITLIDTPILNVDDNAAARASAKKRIESSAKMGAKFCLVHHSSAEQLVNKNTGTMRRLPDYLDMIRQAGLIPGLSAHMPELVIYSDRNEYDVQTYIQIYNCMGFLMQIEVEGVRRVIVACRIWKGAPARTRPPPSGARSNRPPPSRRGGRPLPAWQTSGGCKPLDRPKSGKYNTAPFEIGRPGGGMSEMDSGRSPPRKTLP